MFHGIHGFVGFNVMPLLGLILLIFSFFAAKRCPAPGSGPPSCSG